MAQDFFRKPSEDERRDFEDIGPYKKKGAKIRFQEKLGKVRLEAGKKKIPFFKKAAMDDFDEYYKEAVKKSLRIHGYVKAEEIKPIKTDWDRYSSPTQIDFIEVVDIRDPHASKKHPFDVFVKTYRYKYHGYGVEGESNMSVMEEEQYAVSRARAKYEGKEEPKLESLAEKNSWDYREKAKEPETTGDEEVKIDVKDAL